MGVFGDYFYNNNDVDQRRLFTRSEKFVVKEMEVCEFRN
jgi:hypothetical protein